MAMGNTAVLHRLDPQNSKLAAWHIAERQMGGVGERDVLRLFRKIEAGLCFELERTEGQRPFPTLDATPSQRLK